MSLIVIDSLVCNIDPLTLPERRATVNVSNPSVVESSVGVTVNDPELSVTLTSPVFVVKSPAPVSTVQ